jgi:hypothetical protein
MSGRACARRAVSCFLGEYRAKLLLASAVAVDPLRLWL